MGMRMVLWLVMNACLLGCGGASRQWTVSFPGGAGDLNHWVAFPIDSSELAPDQARLYTRFGCTKDASAEIVEGLLTAPAEAAQIPHLDVVTLESVEVQIGSNDESPQEACAGYRTSDQKWHWQTTVVKVDPTSLRARIPVDAKNVDALALYPHGGTILSATIEGRMQ